MQISRSSRMVLPTDTLLVLFGEKRGAILFPSEHLSSSALAFPGSHPFPFSIPPWTRKGRKSLVPPQAPMSLEYAVGKKDIYNTFRELWHPIWCMWHIPEKLWRCWNIFGCPQTLHISRNSKHCNLHWSVMPQATIVSFTTTQPISFTRMYKCAICTLSSSKLKPYMSEPSCVMSAGLLWDGRSAWYPSSEVFLGRIHVQANHRTWQWKLNVLVPSNSSCRNKVTIDIWLPKSLDSNCQHP